MSRMFKVLGRFAATHPYWICAVWLVVGATVTVCAPDWNQQAQDDDIRFLPERCASVRGYRLLEEAFPQDVFASRIVFAIERADGLSARDLRLVEEMVADLNRLREQEPALQINRVLSHLDPFLGKRFLSDDGKCALIQVSLATPYLALQTRNTVDRAEEILRRRLDQAGEGAPHLYTTGSAGVGRDLTRASANSLESTTVATVVLVVIILLLVHRAPLLALVPLVTIAGSVWVALKLLALGTLIPGFYLVNISQVFAVVMLYGAGTDYCLFLISRYREELAKGQPLERALTRSVGAVGGALAASAGTVICGLGLMALAEFAKVRCGGPAIAVSLAVALAASLTLAPALLCLLGRSVFWPVGMPRPEQGLSGRNPLLSFSARDKSIPLTSSGEGLWGRISRQVVAHPVAVWGTSVALLVPLAVIGFTVKANYRATGELSPTSSSVEGLAILQRHFTAGEVGPVTVLLEAPKSWDSKEGRAIIAHLSQGFARLPNVAEVRSLTQPLGSPLNESFTPSFLTGSVGGPFGHLSGDRDTESPGQGNGFLHSVLRNVQLGLNEQINRATCEVYLARLPSVADGAGDPTPPTSDTTRFVTRLDVVLKTDPFDPQSIPTLDLLQVWLRDELPHSAADWAEIKSECYGVAVNARDLAQVTESDRLRINSLVLCGIFLILLLLVRQPGLAAYLLATVLLSYYATLGATTLAAHGWSGRPLGEVDWRVPFFLFTILVAVGEDYNILLISRALQERKRHGEVEGTRRALARTGGTITSCGLIMAGTFATLMLAGLNTLVQIGFALAFGVLLDTFVVRPFLVPAFTLTLGQSRNEPSRKPTLPLRRDEPHYFRQAS
jgi:RND superfamily putative drug exporter